MSGPPTQSQQPAPLPLNPVLSSATNSRRAVRMNAIPAAAASGPPRSLTTGTESINAVQQSAGVVAPVGPPVRDSASQQALSPPRSASASNHFGAQLTTLPSASSALMATFDPERLYPAYLEARKEIETLKALNNELRNTLAAMVIKQSAEKGRSRGPQKFSETDDIDITDTKFYAKMEKCARWCLIFRACYVLRNHFSGLDKNPSFGVDDPIRFLDDEHIDLGVTEDLRDAIPKRYHNLFSVCADAESTPNDTIGRFRTAASAGRSGFIKMLKDHVSGIFNAPELASQFPLENRFKVQRIQFLIGYEECPNTLDVTFSRFFPAMCLDETERDDNLCRGEILYKIARGIVFGAGAIFNKENAVARSTSQFLRDDKPARTTVGFISLCCIVARFLLSTDKQFDNSGMGSKTSINYKDDYIYYSEFLLNSPKILGPTWLVKLKAQWDFHVFSKQLQSKGGSSTSSDMDSLSASGSGVIDRTADITQRLQEMRLRSGDDGNHDQVDAVQIQTLSSASGSLQTLQTPNDPDDMYVEEAEAPVRRLTDNTPDDSPAPTGSSELPIDATPISSRPTNESAIPSDVATPDQRQLPLIPPSTIIPPVLSADITVEKPRKQSRRAPTVAPASESSEQRRSSRRLAGAGSDTVAAVDSQPVTGNTTAPTSTDAPPAAPKKGRTRGAKGRGQ